MHADSAEKSAPTTENACPPVGSKRRLDAKTPTGEELLIMQEKMAAMETVFLQRYQEIAASLESAQKSLASKDKEISELNRVVRDLRREVDLGKRENILIHVRRWCDMAKKKNRSPLYLACEEGDLEAVKVLLDCTLDMARNESKEIQEFVRQSIDERINKRERRHGVLLIPMKIAAIHGQTEVIDYLLSHDADIEIQDENESTPLHIASAEGNVEVVSLLIARKANIEPIDLEKTTPLQYAVENGHAETVDLLLSEKANIEAKNELTHQTPLQTALNAENIEIMSLLIENRANIEVRDEDQCTPLHNAVEMGSADMVSLLIAHKANINAKNKEGETPLDIAEDEEIQALLSDKP